MVARELAYNIVVGAVQTSGVDFVFGSLNKDIRATQDELRLAEERQKDLNEQIREVKRAGGDYALLQQEFDDTSKEIEGLTQELSNQQAELRESEKRVNTWGTRMKWATGIVTVATGAITALVHVQGQYSRSLVNVEMLTGQSAEEMERLNQAAMRLTGQGLAPEAILGIADQWKQLNYQMRLGNDLSEEQYLALQRLDVSYLEAATLSTEDWYNALLRVPPQLRDVTAQAAGIGAIYML